MTTLDPFPPAAGRRARPRARREPATVAFLAGLATGALVGLVTSTLWWLQ